MLPVCTSDVSIDSTLPILAEHPAVILVDAGRPVGMLLARDAANTLHFGQGHTPCDRIAQPLPRAGRPVSTGSGYVVRRRDGTFFIHTAPQKQRTLTWSNLTASLPPVLVDYLRRVARICALHDAQLYLVGGIVRAVCRRESLTDVDVAVVGAFVPVIDAIAAATGATVLQRSPFGTATLTFPTAIQAALGMASYDIVGARREVYSSSGALPTVTPVDDIRIDLQRRDLTVNAMAIAVHADDDLQLIDPFGGWADIQAKRAKLVHPLSFFEDPTRLVRLARIAARLDLRIDTRLRGLVNWAVVEGLCQGVSRFRWLQELQHTLAEATPAAPILLLQKWGVLTAVMPGARLLRRDAAQLAHIAPSERIVALLWRMQLPALSAVLATWTELPTGLRDLLVLRGQRGRWRRWLTLRPSHSIRALAPLDATVLAAVACLEPALAAVLARHAVVVAQSPMHIRGADLVAAGVPPGPAIRRGLDALQTYLWDARWLGAPPCDSVAAQRTYAVTACLGRQL